MIRFTILGEPASKSNQRRIVNFRTTVALIKSDKALKYEASSRMQIPSKARQMLEGDIKITLHIYYASLRPDLDESLILDILQARFAKVNGEKVLVVAGVYLNDRQIKEKHIYHHIDRRNPRVDVEIEEI